VVGAVELEKAGVRNQLRKKPSLVERGDGIPVGVGH
jgi:hypothetical protein